MAGRLLAALAAVAALLAHWCLSSAPAITIVGNVTVDIVDGKRVLGGAVSYAAAVAAAWGQRACIVAAAAPDAPLGSTFEASLLAAQASVHCRPNGLHACVHRGCLVRHLDVGPDHDCCALSSHGCAIRLNLPLAVWLLQGHDLVIVPSSQTLVFEHSYTFWASPGMTGLGQAAGGAAGGQLAGPCAPLQNSTTARWRPFAGQRKQSSQLVQKKRFSATAQGHAIRGNRLPAMRYMRRQPARCRPGCAPPRPQGNHRKLRVPAQPNVTLGWQHVPLRCRRARTLLLGPLMPEDLDPASFLPGAHPRPWWERALGLAPRRQQLVGLMAQGLQRRLDGGGQVKQLRQPSQQLEQALGPSTLVFLSDVETEVWRNGTVEGLAARTRAFLVTRGGEGADEYLADGCRHHPVYPVDQVVDTNGAGDTFATAYMLAAAAGHSSPVSVAHWAGGLAVSQPQACKPACVTGTLRASWHSMPPSTPTDGWALVQRIVSPPARLLAQLLPRGAGASMSSPAAPAA
ncbi:hypothetical protein ABPG77_010764 [Micractinium sp. CCAP 211/92]